MHSSIAPHLFTNHCPPPHTHTTYTQGKQAAAEESSEEESESGKVNGDAESSSEEESDEEEVGVALSTADAVSANLSFVSRWMSTGTGSASQWMEELQPARRASRRRLEVCHTL